MLCFSSGFPSMKFKTIQRIEIIFLRSVHFYFLVIEKSNWSGGFSHAGVVKGAKRAVQVVKFLPISVFAHFYQFLQVFSFCSFSLDWAEMFLRYLWLMIIAFTCVPIMHSCSSFLDVSKGIWWVLRLGRYLPSWNIGDLLVWTRSLLFGYLDICLFESNGYYDFDTTCFHKCDFPNFVTRDFLRHLTSFLLSLSLANDRSHWLFTELLLAIFYHFRSCMTFLTTSTHPPPQIYAWSNS